MTVRKSFPFVLLVSSMLASSTDRTSAHAFRQPAFGEPFEGLTRQQKALFEAGLEVFQEEEGLGDGLGPIFNNVGCAACHFAPAIGGASELNETRAAQFDGRRYVELPGGSLFQTDAIRPTCAEAVPPEANLRAERQTQPLFGLGLVEAIPDWQIEGYRALQARAFPDQAGRVHRLFDVATGRFRIGRFGWKAQQATLVAFSGDAYVNEMGITSPLFPRENAPNGDQAKLKACDAVADPEDDGEDLRAFADFMRLLAPPPRTLDGRTGSGQRIFERIGCAVCHTAVYRAVSPIAAINGRQVEAFSDFLLHDVGTGDGIVQGAARANELRTAPLWGLSKSAPYLHDGGAATIAEAIQRHSNQGARSASAFAGLPRLAREELLKFLGSI
jgi:CxxC motif-containing protein (DUF1111 family)